MSSVWRDVRDSALIPMKQNALKFALSMTLLIIAIVLLVPLALQWATGRMGVDGSLTTITAGSQIADLRFTSNNQLRTCSADARAFFAPFYFRTWSVPEGKMLTQRLVPIKSVRNHDLLSGGRYAITQVVNPKTQISTSIIKDTNNGAVVSRLAGGSLSNQFNTLTSNEQVLIAFAETPFSLGKRTQKKSGIKAWEIKTGKEKWFAEESTSFFYRQLSSYIHLALSPDGKYLAEITSLRSEPKHPDSFVPETDYTYKVMLILRDAETGQRLRVFDEKTAKEANPIIGSLLFNWNSVCWSPDSKRIAALANTARSFQKPAQTEIQVWDAVTGKIIWKGQRENVQSTIAAFSPDGSRLAVGNRILGRADGFPGGDVTIWDAKTGTPLVTYQRETRADALNYAWHARLRRAKARINEKLQKPPFGYMRGADDKSLPITHLAFSPDGKRLAAADESGTVKIWPVP